MWSVKCGVWSAQCGVWSVEWKVWSVKCGVSAQSSWQVAEFLQNQISPVFLFHSIFFGGRDSQAVA